MVTLYVHRRKRGVRNGVDYDVWNPDIERVIPHRYSVDSVDRKYWNKDALRDPFQMMALTYGTAPIVRAIGGLELRSLMLNGMRADYSWNCPGQDYLNIYEYIPPGD